MVIETDWRDDLAADRHGAAVYTSLAELRQAPALASAHATEIAWEKMDLSGVVAIGDAPVAYVRRVRGYDVEAEGELHRRHWLNGTAPLLLVVDDDHLRAYSSRPRKPGVETGKDSCIQVLSRLADAYEIKYLLERVRTGTYFQEHHSHFRRSNGVDHRLLRQLRQTRNALWSLDEGVGLSDCHTLIVRAIVLRYLADRGVLDRDFFSACLGASSETLHSYVGQHAQEGWPSLSRLYGAIAQRLGIREFQETQVFLEGGRFSHRHFDLLAQFLRDEEPGGGQLSLGTWRYDFSILPVELISAVYQEFIYDEVPTAKRDLGLVPTPRFLAEVVLGLAFEGLPAGRPRVLDPACGSGIFLVGCFNRIAHAWRLANPRAGSRRAFKALKDILAQDIVGVEIEQTACELARLNMIHALLSHMSSTHLRDIILDSATQSADLLPATAIVHKDFFAEEPALTQGSFDLVVGNPPWSNTGVDGWTKRYPGRPMPERGNLVYAFAWSAGDYLTPGGRACMLLDGKAMLFSATADEFAKSWYSAYDVDLVVNLAAFRSILFKEAGRAAAIFRFRPSTTGNKAMTFVSPWASGATSHGSLLDLSDAKTELIRAEEVRAWAARDELPRLFRPRLFGSGRDLALIERLRTFPSLSDRGWSIHQGFNRHGTNRAAEERPMVLNVPFLPTSQPRGSGTWAGSLPITRFTRTYGTEPTETALIRQWPADIRVFSGGRVLMHQTPLQRPSMFRAAWTTDDLTFHKEIRAIYRDGATQDELRLLAGVLMSEVAYYYFFHTSLSWGVEAEPQVRRSDVAGFPAPPTETSAQRSAAELVVRAVASLEAAGPEYSHRLEEVRRDVSRAARSLYGLDEWETDLVRDALASAAIVAFGGGVVPKEVVTAGPLDCTEYLERLLAALRAWSPGRESLHGTAFISRSAQLGVILLSRQAGARPASVETLEDDDELSEVLARLREIASTRYGWTSAPTNLVMFDGDQLYITKSLGSRHWTRTAALNDADTLAAEILGRSH